MMKCIMKLLILIFSVFPLGVFAIAVGGSAPYFSVEGQQAYCIEAGLQPPKSVSGPTNLSQLVHLGTYRMSLIVPESEWLPSEARSELQNTGRSAYLTHDAVLAQSLGYAWAVARGNNNANWPAYSTKLACGGLYAVGKQNKLSAIKNTAGDNCSAGESPYDKCIRQNTPKECQGKNMAIWPCSLVADACSNVSKVVENTCKTFTSDWRVRFNDCSAQLEGYSKTTLDLLKLSAESFNPEFIYDDAHSNKSSWQFAFKLGGRGFTNIKNVINNFGNMGSSIRVTGCQVTNNSSYSCSTPGAEMLPNNYVTLNISGPKPNGNITLKVKITYNYIFPFAGTGVKVYNAGGGYQDLAIFSGTNTPTRKTAEVQIPLSPGGTPETPPPSNQCEVTTNGNGTKIYKYQGKNVSISDYINNGCCDDLTADDVKNNATAKSLYESKCEPPQVTKCEVKTSYGIKTYKYNGNSVSIVDYISYGCCDDITADDVKNNTTAKNLYYSICEKPEVEKCEVSNINGMKLYKYEGISVGLVKYIENGCCDDVTAADVKYNTAAKELYDSKCDSNQTTVSPRCEIVTNGNERIYKNNGKVVTIINYINAGCCDNLTSEDLANNPNAQNVYNSACTANDRININNECGVKSNISTTNNAIGDTNISILSCQNENYIDYSHSSVEQMKIDNVLDRVTQLEQSITNVQDIYNNAGLNNYEDRSYMNSSISGKDGKSLSPIDSNNNYCMLFTSENDRFHFPGTAIATSGRFFVFNELSKSECVNSINYSQNSNCFRQPYIEGSIDAVMHTNYNRWDKDYKEAIEKEKTAYNDWQTEIVEGPIRESQALAAYNDCTTEAALKPSMNNYCQNLQAEYLATVEENKRRLVDYENFYNVSKQERKQLEKYKEQCESRVDLANYWSYDLNPTLNFSYAQKVYDGKGHPANDVVDTVSMTKSTESVKYWPNVSTDVKCTPLANSGGRNIIYNINYGNVNEMKTFNTTENYSISCNQTIYYRPNKETYATVPGGNIIDTVSYQTNPIYMYEVGYVYNVQLTTYEGTYTTYFDIDRLGHRASSGESNVQKILDQYKIDHNLQEISSECVYCNQEGAFKRECPTCDDLGASYIYRTIALSNVTPNDRENTNWSDNKGKSAEARIQAASGDNILSSLKSTISNDKATLLKDSKEESVELIADNIYNDQSKKYLEYEITLTTKDMNIIRDNTARRDFSYSNVSYCANRVSVNEKSADADYCYRCNEDGKECSSTFIDAFGNDTITATTRREKWKYYINNSWVTGNWKSIVSNYTKLEGFESGRYPDPDNQEAFLKQYNNWP